MARDNPHVCAASAIERARFSIMLVMAVSGDARPIPARHLRLFTYKHVAPRSNQAGKQLRQFFSLTEQSLMLFCPAHVFVVRYSKLGIYLRFCNFFLFRSDRSDWLPLFDPHAGFGNALPMEHNVGRFRDRRRYSVRFPCRATRPPTQTFPHLQQRGPVGIKRVCKGVPKALV